MSEYVTSPLAQDIFGVLAPWLATITGLTAGTTVIQGIPNRSPEPLAAPGYISMTMVRRRRLNYNIDTWDQTIDDPDTWTTETHFEVTIQLDIVGESAFDWCSMIESLWRDEQGCIALAGANNYPSSPLCQPLYTQEPIMAPLEDSEDQYEQRWILQVVLQYNPVTTTPLQTADTVELTVINVDEAYPP